MDYSKTGEMIRNLRKKKNLTQQMLADMLHISDRAVSKWECGQGCPDVSLLSELSKILGADIEALLEGNSNTNEEGCENMKKLKFYVCEDCGNIITSMSEAGISCCAKKLAEITPKKAEEGEKLSVEQIENDYYISSNHEMSKEHYINFVAFLTGDTLIMRRQYPEWDLSVRIPRIGHGKLIWGCTKHGIYYQLV